MEKQLEDILNFLAWSGDSAMGTSLMAAVLDKKEEELQETLDKGTNAGSLHKKEERYEIDPKAGKERQEQFPLSENREWVINGCRSLGNWFEERRKETTDLPAFEAELTHLKEWANHVKPFSTYHHIRLTWLQAYPPYHGGKYDEALQQVQTAQKLLEQAPGEDDDLEEEAGVKLKADIFHDIAAVQDEMENTDEALANYRKALDIQVNHFGEQHPDTAETIGNIAATYDRMGNQEEALKYFQQALEIRQQLFGDQHPDTATSFNNIGTSYYEAQRYAEAIQYLEQAVQTRLQVLGEEHPDTNDSLYNLAVCLTNLKKLKDAYERVSRHLKKLPSDHPNYAELAGMLRYIDKESVKSGFRPMSAAGKGSKKKKKKKKKKR